MDELDIRKPSAACKTNNHGYHPMPMERPIVGPVISPIDFEKQLG